jgi:hypothetical protein
MNEQCWFIYGIRFRNKLWGVLKYHSEGSSCQVKFDWAKAVGKVIGFYHSHPSGFTGPSSRDDRTMKAWVISEGKPMVCGIFCDGKYRTFLYQRGVKNKIFCSEIRAVVHGRRIFNANIFTQNRHHEVN